MRERVRRLERAPGDDGRGFDQPGRALDAEVPEVAVGEVLPRLAATRARSETGQRPQTTFRGALYLPGDELVLCLFESSSRTSVKSASERAGMPCERVIETVWVAPDSRGGSDRCGG